jgi:CBS domain-containing protein
MTLPIAGDYVEAGSQSTRPHPTAPMSTAERRVVWAGGGQAQDLANSLAASEVTKSGSNLVSSCIDSRADLLVLSNRTSLSLCSTAVPHGFRSDATNSIVAAVGGGPHSFLAATLASWLSDGLGVPASVVVGYSDPTELFGAQSVLDQVTTRLPQLNGRTVEAHSPQAMVQALPSGTLLIVGAPGGSWFQKRFFGPGARIRAKASDGTIVVSHSPPCVYQVMQPPVAFGPRMWVADALLLSEGFDVHVAERGKLLGTVRIEALEKARPDLEIHQIMDTEVFLSVDDPIDEAAGLVTLYGDGLVPVVDNQSYLVGSVSGEVLAANRRDDRRHYSTPT